MCPPLRPLAKMTREEQIFADLRQAIPKPEAWEARKNEWILEDMCRLVEKIISMRLDPTRNKSLIRRLGR